MNGWFWVLLAGAALWVMYQQWWLRRGIPQASVHDIKGMLDTRQKYFLVDVREPVEFSGGHIPQAVNVPLGSLEQRAADWSRDRQIYVVCASGRRSIMACRKLAGMGFTQVANVEGGMRRWPWGTV